MPDSAPLIGDPSLPEDQRDRAGGWVAAVPLATPEAPPPPFAIFETAALGGFTPADSVAIAPGQNANSALEIFADGSDIAAADHGQVNTPVAELSSADAIATLADPAQLATSDDPGATTGAAGGADGTRIAPAEPAISPFTGEPGLESFRAQSMGFSGSSVSATPSVPVLEGSQTAISTDPVLVPSADFPSQALSSGQLTELHSELASVLATLQGLLTNKVFAESLPLLGQVLGTSAAQSVRQAIGAFHTFETALLSTVQSLAVGSTARQLADALNAVAATSGFGGTVSASVDPSNNLVVNFNNSGVFSAGSVTLDSAFGLPGLGFASAAGSAPVTLGYGFQEQVTIPVDGIAFADSLSGPELSVNVNVGAPSFGADADLGFLRYTATDAGSFLQGTFAVSSSGSVGFQGAANLAVNLKTDLVGGKFPSISTELTGSWQFGNAATGDFADVDPNNPFNFGTTPTIELNNVTLDIGSFLKQFLLPIYSDIMLIIAPFQPVIDLFNNDNLIPFLSQFLNTNDAIIQNFDKAGLLSLTNPSGFTGDGKITLLDLMALDTGNPTYQTFVKAISAINSFEQLGTIISQAGTGQFDLGSFRVAGDIRAPGFDITTDVPTIEQATQNLDTTLSNLAGLTPDQRDILQRVLEGNAPGSNAADRQAITIGSPLLSDPIKAAELLLGASAPDLFTLSLTPPPFEEGQPFDSPPQDKQLGDFPLLVVPGGLDFTLNGALGAEFNLQFGYDTSGLKSFATGGFTDPSQLFNGFYFSPVTQNGATLPVFNLIGDFFAGASALDTIDGGGFLHAFVDAGFATPAKQYFQNLQSVLQNSPASLWHLDGQVAVGARFDVLSNGATIYSSTPFSATFPLFNFGGSGPTEPGSPGPIHYATNPDRGELDDSGTRDPSFNPDDFEAQYNWAPPSFNISNDGSVAYFGDATISLNAVETINLNGTITKTWDVHDVTIAGTFIDDLQSLSVLGSDASVIARAGQFGTNITITRAPDGSVPQTHLIQAGGTIIIEGTGADSRNFSQMTITNLGFSGGFANLGVIDLNGTLGVDSLSHIYGPGTLQSEIVPSVIQPFNAPGKLSDFPNLPATLQNTINARFENDGNTISGAIQIAVPLTNKGTINADSTIGPLQILGDVANYTLLEASPAVVTTVSGATYSQTKLFIGGSRNIFNYGGTIAAENGGDVFFGNNDTIWGGLLISQAPSAAPATGFVVQGAVTFNGNVASVAGTDGATTTPGIDIEGTVNIGGLGFGAFVQPSTLTLTGLIDSQPYTANRGGSVIEAIGPQSELWLLNATVEGGEIAAMPVGTVAAGTIRVVQTATIDSILNNPGVAVGGFVQVDNAASLVLAANIVPDANLSGGIEINGGTLRIGRSGRDKALLETNTSVQGDLRLTDGGTNLVTGFDTSSVLENDWTIEGAGVLGDGKVQIVNEPASPIVAGQAARPGGLINANATHSLIVNSGSRGVINQSLMEATNGGVLDLTGNVSNAGGTIGANGGVVSIDGATIAGGLLTQSLGLFFAIGNAGLDGSASALTIDTAVVLTDGPNGYLTIKGAIVNHGTIQVEASAANPALASVDQPATLQIVGNAVLTGGGLITLSELSGANSAATQIVTGLSSAALDNIDNRISGVGLLGNGSVKLTNEVGGGIFAIGGMLVINGGGAGFINHGQVTATTGSTLVLAGNVVDTGDSLVADGGTIGIQGVIAGGSFATPNNGLILLDSGTLDGSANTVTIPNGVTINVLPELPSPGVNTSVLEGSIANLGEIFLQSDSSKPNNKRSILLAGTVRLSGGGLVAMSDLSATAAGAADSIVGATGADTIDNVDNKIVGFGTIGATGNGALTLTNETAGIVDAAGGELFLNLFAPGNHSTNQGLIEAIGGTIDLSGSIDNTAGTIRSLNDGTPHSGTILIDGLTVTGGTLAGDQTDLGSLIGTTTKNGTLDGTATPVTIANTGHVLVAHNTSLTLLGSIVDQGTISVIGLPGSVISGDANVVISGTVNLTGGGPVFLSRGPAGVLHGDAIVAGKSVADRLNNGVTISGSGFLGASKLTIDNQAAGTVIADGGTLAVNTGFRSGHTLTAGSSPITNAGLLTSVTTGLLDLISDVVNTGGTIGASGGGITWLDNNIVSGGTFDGSGGGRILSSFSTIDATAFPVTLTSGAIVGVQANVPVAFAATDTLTLKGSFINHGTLLVLHNANSEDLGINISDTVTLSGGGQLQILDTLFSGFASPAFVQGDNHGTITNYSSNTLDNVDNLISGNGRLGNPSLRITNEAAGIISAISGSTLLVSTLSGNSLATKGGVVNQGLMRALGGTLDLVADIDNRGGTIAALSDGAGHSGTVIIDDGSLSGVIKGGTFTSDPGDPNSFIQAGAGTIDGSNGAVTLTAGAPLHIVPDSTLSATGTIVNLGTVVIFSNTLSGVSPALVPAGTLVMTGGGRVAMSFTGGAPDYIRGTSDADLLDNVDNTIIGFGRIGESQMSLLNEAAGTIAAQGGTLIARIDSTVNRGLLEALGGTLQLIGTIANAGGTIAARNDGAGHSGTVLLAGVTIQGGVLTTDVADPASVITALNSSANLLDGSASALTLAAGNQLQLGPTQKVTLTGAIVNQGTIALAAAQSVAFNSTAQLFVAGTATLTGAGLISLTDTSGLGGTHEQVVTGTAKTDTLDNVDNTISGVGLLGSGFMTLINEAAGTIIASGGSLIVDTGTIAAVNHGRMGAAVGGTIDIRSAVSNSGGTIGGGGGIALIDNAGRVLGGTLIGQIYGLFGTIDGVANAVTLTAGATLAVDSTVPSSFSNLLYLKGTIANHGTMLLRDDDSGLTVQTQFIVSGAAALTGGGLVSLTGKTAKDTGTGNIITGSVLADTLDNIDNTIAGFGRLGAGAMTLINEAAGKVSATGGTLTVYTGAAAITNTGLLTSGTGGVLDLLSSVTNTGGTIAADGGVTRLENITVHGGVLSGSLGGTILVPNSATLDGTANSIVLASGALLAVAANSTLTLSGVVAEHGTISNSGSIANIAALVLDGTLINDGTLSSGVALTGAGNLTNKAGRTVPGTATATSSSETIFNLGTIAGAVSLAGGDRLITGAGAVFGGGISGGTGGNTLEIATGPYTLTNFSAAGTPQYSTLQIDAGVTVTPDATDILSGVTLINRGQLNLTAFTAGAPVENDGSITGDVTLTSGVSLINSAGGTISGSGLAVIEALGLASVVNSGVIDPATYGVDLTAGGSVTNTAGGTIEGTVTGVLIAGGDGTVTNGGTIIGGGLDAVTLAAGFSNRVILDAGAVFVGLVDGGNTIGASAVSILELAPTGGTITGFSTEFINFAQLRVDQNASWVLDQANTIAAGTTLADQGSLLISGNSVAGGGVVTVDGVGGLQAAMKIAGGGSWSGNSPFAVGGTGGGSLAIDTTGTVSIAGAEVAANAGSSGEITVSGTNSLLTNIGSFVVGDAGLGGVAIEAGGTVTNLAGLVIASNASASGSSVDVTGGESNLLVTGTLTVGGAGFGQLSLSQGATVTAAALDAAAATGGGGGLSLTDVGTALNVSGLLTVGDQSSGSLNIANGAAVTAGGLAIGTGVTGSGNVVIGPGSHLTITGTLINVGLAGSAVLDIQGGTLGLASGTTLSPGTFGRIVQVGGLIDPATVFDASGGSFGGGGTAEASGTIVNSGQASVTGGAETLLAPLITSNDPANTAGTWSIKSGGSLVLDVNTFDNSQTIQFGDATGVLTIGQQVTLDATQTPVTIAASALNGFAAPIVGYKAGDKITFTGVTVASDQVSGNVVTLFDSGNKNLGSLTFQTGKGGPDTNGAALAAAQIACFAAGTRIATPSGPRAVEELAVGDPIVLADGGSEPIVWIGQRAVNCRAHPKPETVWPVRVSAGAFGANVPVCELYLSPDHAIYVNGALVPVKLLINGTSITQLKRDHVTYFHVELPEHAVILAEGLTVESYLDTGDRANFNVDTGIIRLFPNFTARLMPSCVLIWEVLGAAPQVVTGTRLKAARRAVAPNAARRHASSAEPISRPG